MSAMIIASPWINGSALWKIIVVGLLAGAGLPAIFAIGLRAINHRSSGIAVNSDDSQVYGGDPGGLAAGLLCFAVVLAAIGYGIYFIVKSSS
jgi:hypothetical protein